VDTASSDGTAAVWDAATGKLFASMEHQAPVWTAAFSPDGTRVVTASSDRTARLWDSLTGEPATVPREPAAASVARVIPAGADRAARSSDVRPVRDTLEQWADVAARSPFVLDDGGRLVLRSKRRTH
jgi:WD40 repeat protein